MKKLIFSLMLSAITAHVVFAQTAAPVVKSDETTETVSVGPKANWDVIVYDFGEIPFMVSKDAQFTLTNNGNEPLLITSARASCGCTNLRYSKDPILPGNSTTMSVTYNGSGNGQFKKAITVQTNASDKPTILQIKGTVIK